MVKLLEHKGKELLKRCGIRVPPGIVTDNKSYVNLSYHKERYREFFFEHGSVVIKAQVVSGGRGKEGLVVTSNDYKESLSLIDQLYQREWNGRPINTLLIEKRLEVAEEYYLSILYDTRSRKPMMLLSRRGGVEVEELAREEAPASLIIQPSAGLTDFQARVLAKKAGFTGSEMLTIASFLQRAWECFSRFDCLQLEVNPLIKTRDGLLYAGDAKITIDDNGLSRQEFFHDVTDVEDRSLLSERALAARRIDYHDHRGVAGKTFIELDGDIAILASGGGASLACMDAIIEAGGEPANYAEYSGNPPREKVRRLTEITLSRPGLAGCLVIGGTANFTDIFETLSGFAEGLLAVTPKPDYPIVVRRAGPRDKEAFAMLRRFAMEHGFDLSLYGEETPMSVAARIIIEKARAWKEKAGGGGESGERPGGEGKGGSASTGKSGSGGGASS